VIIGGLQHELEQRVARTAMLLRIALLGFAALTLQGTIAVVAPVVRSPRLRRVEVPA
jgi:hypothetical protein